MGPSGQDALPYGAPVKRELPRLTPERRELPKWTPERFRFSRENSRLAGFDRETSRLARIESTASPSSMGAFQRSLGYEPASEIREGTVSSQSTWVIEEMIDFGVPVDDFV